MQNIINLEQSNTVLSETSSTSEINFQTCVKVGNRVLIVSCIFFIFSILVSYPFAELFTIPQQIAGHIGTMIFPGFIKIGYVVRCVGIKGLGLKV